MHRYLKIAVGSLLPAALLAGCSNWLTGTDLTTNPNSPTVASAGALLIGVETGQTVVQTGDLARLFSMWMQSMAGTDRQYIPLGSYIFDEDAFSGDWNGLYAGGGLIDERAIQQKALAAGDSTFAGVGKVMEALTMGTAADVWGDVPYREAVSTVLQPHLDPQQQVYQDVQAQLDTAIEWLPCSTAACIGPEGNDLIYGGDRTKWLALAHTLKARYYMHVGPMDASAYAKALTEAQSGIASPAGDFSSYQSTDPNEWNLWYQFMVVQRSGYISAGAYLINLLQAAGDPRLAGYYSKIDSGFYRGAPNVGGNGDYSTLSAVRGGQGFRQPIATYAETQLIIAETQLRAGNQASAIAAYNAERASQGVSAWPSGTIALSDIITEKYIADFQEIEVWNDYKRTCLPVLVPAPPATAIPGRLLYPLSAERDANPNVPPPDQQPALNWNQPAACTPVD